jgi:L-asparaginase II
MTNNPVLVEALRGGIVESAHRGALAIVDADGALHTALGDIERPVFARSAVKLLQALPLVESGAAERLGLSDEELALACASHNGEPAHVRACASMLAKAGVDAGALECGAHWPYLDTATRELARRGDVPSALHNNCSGKHAGFVCLGCQMSGGAAPRGFRASTGHNLARAAVGVDGCSIPTYAIPLRRLAHAFARAGTGVGLRPGHASAAARLRQAVANAPFMVAGTGRFDTVVMQRLGARVFCKVGAEGVYCAALPEQGLGVAIKVDDGNNARACEVVMAAVIGALVRLDDGERGFIQALADLRLANWNGTEVGRLRASPALALAG